MTVVAAFDLDGTVTRRDTLIPFLWFVRGPGLAIDLLRAALALVGYALRLIPNWQAKERLLATTLGGQPIDALRAAGHAFARERLPAQVRSEALRRIAWHRERGHRLVLVTASLDLYVEPWAAAAGFDEVIASRLEVVDGHVTGRLEGGNCYGPEKTRRLQERLGPTESYQLWAYGDSRGDRELLAAADHPYYRDLGVET